MTKRYNPQPTLSLTKTERKAILLEAAQAIQRGTYGACVAMHAAAEKILGGKYSLRQSDWLVDQMCNDYAKHFGPSARLYRKYYYTIMPAYWGDLWGYEPKERWHERDLKAEDRESQKCRILALLFYMQMQEE